MPIISKTTAQQIVDSVKEVSGQDINFINEKGLIIASTDSTRIDTFHEIGYQVIQQASTIEVSDDDCFYGTRKGINIPVSHNGKVVAAIGITGELDKVRKYAFLAQKITSLLLRERELDSLGVQKKNRMNFLIRSLIHQENLDSPYLKELLQKYHFVENTPCRLILVQLNSKYNPQNLFMIQHAITQAFEQTGSPLYTFEYPNEYLLILKEDSLTNHIHILKKLALSYQKILKVSIGSCTSLAHISTSYHCARLAAGSVPFGEALLSYDSLDLELILGNITPILKEQFLEKTITALDKQERELLSIYFEEDMSLQKTCDRLFMHKNSLQYKLNRIHTLCGYNPRRFQDAVVLYSALKICELYPEASQK